MKITEITVSVGRTVNLPATYESLRPGLAARVILDKPENVANRGAIDSAVHKVQAALEASLDRMVEKAKTAHAMCAAGKAESTKPPSVDDFNIDDI